MLILACASCQALASDDLATAELTREQWQQRVQEAKERVQRMRREGVSFAPGPSQIEMDRSRQALDDPDLSPGDIVSTKDGLLLYQGTSNGKRRFVPWQN